MESAKCVQNAGQPPPGPESTDAELLRKVGGGDWNAFDQFVERYERRLLSYLTLQFAPRPGNHLAEDLSQETFLRIFRAARGGRMCDGSASVATWMFAIAKNVARDHFRAAGRSPVALTSELSPGTSDWGTASSREADPAATAERLESDEAVRSLLAQLPAAQAEVITLRLFGELRFEEIAEVVGVPLTTVKSRMTYGLQKIGTMLKQTQGGTR